MKTGCECELCGKGPADGVTVFRVNPTGVEGIWRCRKCITSEQADKLDPEGVRIANIIDPPSRATAEQAGKERAT